MKLPNFLIVGAAKSGTTSLFHYLKQHPEVFMPSFKEPQYLVASKVRGRVFKNISVLEDYKGLFEDASQKAVGEASVFYLYFYKEAIQNIKTILGDTQVPSCICLKASAPFSKSLNSTQFKEPNFFSAKILIEYLKSLFV